MRAAPQRFEYRIPAQQVFGVFWLGPLGKVRRKYRKLSTFAEARITPAGEPDPAWSHAQRDAFLNPLWLAARQQLEQAAARVEASGIPTFRALSDEWLKAVAARPTPGAARTAEMYTLTRDRWLRLMGPLPLDAIKRSHLRDYAAQLAASGLSPTTVNVDLKHLRAFLRWAEDELHDRDVDFRAPRVKIARAPVRRLEHPPDAALAAAFRELTWRIIRGRNQIPHRRTGEAAPRLVRGYELLTAICLRRLLVIDSSSGMRRGELISRRVADCDLTTHSCFLEVTKEGKPRFASWEPPVSAWLREDLTLTPGCEWLFPGQHDPKTGRRGPLWPTPNAATKAMARLWADVGFADRGWKPIHGNRARVITTLIEAGATEQDAALIVGHSQVTTTQGYVTHHAARKQRVLGLVSLVAPFQLENTARKAARGAKP